MSTLAAARRVADAVLYEGYLLYPYRASSAKNQLRWQFGLLSPRGAAVAGVGEDPGLTATVLLRPVPGTLLEVHVRFLQVQWRAVQSLVDGRYVSAQRLRVGDTEWVPWHEAVERDVVVTVPVEDLLGGRVAPVAVPGGEDTEQLRDPGGRVAGRLVRTRWPVEAELTLAGTEVGGFLRLTVGLRNTADWDPAESTRDLAARRGLAGAHLLLAGPPFVSLVDPPANAAPRDRKASADHRASRAPRASRARKAPSAPKAIAARKATRVTRARRETAARRCACFCPTTPSPNAATRAGGRCWSATSCWWRR